MIRLVVAAIFLAALPAIASAQSSSAAAWLMQEQIAEACGGAGRIDPSGLIERDLTGDGRDDLIIAHEAIECTGSGGMGGRSLFCGMQVCSVKVYVRRGDLLELSADYLGGGIRVEGGAIPTIRGYAHGGAPQAVRWNGREFAGP